MFKIEFLAVGEDNKVTLARSVVDTFREAKVVALAKVCEHLQDYKLTLTPYTNGCYEVMSGSQRLGLLNIRKV